MARNCRPRTVPSWRPIASAASRTDSPAKKRSSIASRWSSVRVDSASATASIVLAEHRQRRRARRLAAGSIGRRGEVGVLVARPDVVDDRVPGQPEQPAPERDAPRLVARERLQGLDEDELRQVLRVARAVDAAGDVAIDRPVIVVEQAPEGLGSPRLPPRRAARSPRRRGS